MKLNIQGWLIKRVIQTGMILPFGGPTAPDGFLICNGGAISRTTYADLFAVIGTNYGAGDGTTTFNLPNISPLYLLNGLNVNTPAQNCRGNGLALGLLTGNGTYPVAGLRCGDGAYSSALTSITGCYGVGIGTGASGVGVATGLASGLTTNADYSGVMRDAVTSSISNYQMATAIIKY